MFTVSVTRREFATSPIAFLSPTLLPSIPFTSQSPPSAKFTPLPAAVVNTVCTSRKSNESRQVTALRQRILRLQQQVALLKKMKMTAVQSEETLRDTVAKLKTELSSVTGRMKAAKQHIQVENVTMLDQLCCLILKIISRVICARKHQDAVLFLF